MSESIQTSSCVSQLEKRLIILHNTIEEDTGFVCDIGGLIILKSLARWKEQEPNLWATDRISKIVGSIHLTIRVVMEPSLSLPFLTKTPSTVTLASLDDCIASPQEEGRLYLIKKPSPNEPLDKEADNRMYRYFFLSSIVSGLVLFVALKASFTFLSLYTRGDTLKAPLLSYLNYFIAGLLTVISLVAMGTILKIEYFLAFHHKSHIAKRDMPRIIVKLLFGKLLRNTLFLSIIFCFAEDPTLYITSIVISGGKVALSLPFHLLIWKSHIHDCTLPSLLFSMLVCIILHGILAGILYSRLNKILIAYMDGNLKLQKKLLEKEIGYKIFLPLRAA